MPEILAELQNHGQSVIVSPKKIISSYAVSPRITPFTRLSEKAANLETETTSVGGVVLRAAEETVIAPKGKGCISTELQMAIPDGFYGRIAPLDSLAQKFMIQAGAGVIDSDYRGTVKVLLFNHGDAEFTVAVGDEIAKIVFEEIFAPSEIKWRKAEENATLPVVGSQFAAGADLTAAEECVVPAIGRCVVKTNLVAEFPDGCYGRVAPRSGLAAKKFIHVLGGVCTKQNESIQVLLFNHSQEEFKIAAGDRIAQFILQKAAASTAESEDTDENGEPKAKCAKTNASMFAEICAPSGFSIQARGKTTITVDIAHVVPSGHYARVAPLFALAEKHSIDVGGGVHTTNGAVDLTLFNYGSEEVAFERNQPIAQLMFEKAEEPVFKLCESLEETTRGAGGFGSTGVSSK